MNDLHYQNPDPKGRYRWRYTWNGLYPTYYYNPFPVW